MVCVNAPRGRLVPTMEEGRVSAGSPCEVCTHHTTHACPPAKVVVATSDTAWLYHDMLAAWGSKTTEYPIKTIQLYVQTSSASTTHINTFCLAIVNSARASPVVEGLQQSRATACHSRLPTTSKRYSCYRWPFLPSKSPPDGYQRGQQRVN